MMDFPLLLRTFLLRSAKYFPKKEIVSVFPESVHRYTYADYYKRVCQLAHALKSLGIKRGDRVGVKVTPVEGDKPGQARFLDVLINNMPPQVTESKQVSFDGKTFVYQVKGTDPDGDTVSYALEDAPAGMTINSQTGLITWPIKENDYGEKIFKVRIDDGKSGTAIHPVKVDISKPSQEEKPSEEQK